MIRAYQDVGVSLAALSAAFSQTPDNMRDVLATLRDENLASPIFAGPRSLWTTPQCEQAIRDRMDDAKANKVKAKSRKDNKARWQSRKRSREAKRLAEEAAQVVSEAKQHAAPSVFDLARFSSQKA